MIATGLGCFTEIVEEWNTFHTASENCVVVQPQSVSGIASMRIRGGKWEIELGS
jgi:hypothetical protein